MPIPVIDTASPVRLVAMDFDLTIYDYREPAATVGLIPWFTRLSQRGVMTGLVTGREYWDLRKTLTELGFIWSAPFPSYVICEEGEICKPDGTPWPGAEPWNRSRREKVAQGNVQLVPMFEDLVKWATARNIPVTRPITAGNCGVNVVFDTPANGQIVLDELRRRLGADSPFVSSRNHHIVLAMPRGCDKGAALTEFRTLCGLQAHEVLAIGDNLNDWSMLCDGHGFRPATVANAVPELLANVKQRGGLVAKLEVSRGVAEIFETVFA